MDRLEEGGAQAHDRRALDLVRQAVGVDDRAALECGHDAEDLEAPVVADAHRHAGGDAGALLHAAGDAHPEAGLAGPAGPVHALGRGVEDRREPFVAEVPQAELERVDAERVRQLVHVRLAGEVVRRRGQGPIRALGQRRVGGLVVEALVGDLVRPDEAEHAGVRVAQLPRRDGAIPARAAADVDDRRRAEGSPG